MTIDRKQYCWITVENDLKSNRLHVFADTYSEHGLMVLRMY